LGLKHNLQKRDEGRKEAEGRGKKKGKRKAIIKPDAHPRKEQQRHAEEANERP
jgi:hypothetical protein